MYQITTTGPADTKNLGCLLGQLVRPGDVICLNGDLGAGKTHFSQGIAMGLGVKEHVTSPTFTLINEYQGRLPLYHMDVYRLGGAEDMADLGYEEYFYDEGVCLVEWADLVAEVLPPERLDVEILTTGANQRLISFTPRGQRYSRLVEELFSIVRTGN